MVIIIFGISRLFYLLLTVTKSVPGTKTSNVNPEPESPPVTSEKLRQHLEKFIYT